MNISFTDKQEKYIRSQLESGDFKNASEVVRDALRLHQLYRYKNIEELRAEISEGWNGAHSSRTPSQIAQDKLDALNPPRPLYFNKYAI
jgi:antitoxin ParD1/3/4